MVESANGFNFCWTKRGIIGRIGLYFVINHPEENRKETERSPHSAAQWVRAGEEEPRRAGMHAASDPSIPLQSALHRGGAGEAGNKTAPPSLARPEPRRQFQQPIQRKVRLPRGQKGVRGILFGRSVRECSPTKYVLI